AELQGGMPAEDKLTGAVKSPGGAHEKPRRAFAVLSGSSTRRSTVPADPAPHPDPVPDLGNGIGMGILPWKSLLGGCRAWYTNSSHSWLVSPDSQRLSR